MNPSVPPAFDWSTPYPSHRQPVFAANAVASSQALATQAGLGILQRGGNAVDAAVAAAVTLTVVEPVANGVGGDLFAIVWDGRELSGLNASGRAPAAASAARYRQLQAMPTQGWESVTIPGAVSGWAALSQRYGSLPFADLFEPAIRYAFDGYVVSRVVAKHWARAVPHMSTNLGFPEHFLPGGRAPYPGERWHSRALANTLSRIAQTAGHAFYRGELAEAMVAHASAHGAVHTLEDFANHTIDWDSPLSLDYRGLAVHEMPPNSQGIASQMALGMLRTFDLASLKPDSPDSQHLQIEAMKLAFADVHRFVSDPATMEADAAALLDPGYLAKRASLIDHRRAQRFGPGSPPQGGTVYLAAADEHGMMVSLIQSNYMGFGSGVVVPGTGIAMQNRGAGFSLVHGHPNEIGGGKRSFHTIMPGFVTRDGAPFAAFGVMGGPMQPPGHLQVMVRMIDYRMQPQAAIDAPRWKIAADGAVVLEATASVALAEALTARGHVVHAGGDSEVEFGAGQCIVRLAHGYAGASDPRRDGQAAGF